MFLNRQNLEKCETVRKIRIQLFWVLICMLLIIYGAIGALGIKSSLRALRHLNIWGEQDR